MTGYNGRGLHGQVVDAIGRAIVGGDFAEGSTLDLERIQADHDVSLTVVREALKVLAGKGLIGARQRRGTFVQPRSEWNLLDPDVLAWEITPASLPRMLRELEEIREIFEPAAAALAATRRDDDDIASMRAALDEMRAATDPMTATAADLAFHRAVSAAAKNDLLTRVELLTRSLFEERDRIVHERVPGSATLAQHGAIVEAIVDRDADAARRATDDLLGRASADPNAATSKKERP
jgi:DNA-binding FadR family transcriptional regulator